MGTGGFIALTDYDLTDPDPSKHVARAGHAQFVPANRALAVKTEGFCFGTEEYSGAAAYRLEAADMSPHGDHPPGLPAGPWKVGPTKLRRLAEDFELPRDREALLSDIAGFSGGCRFCAGLRNDGRPRGAGPAKTTGYHLLAELEQIYGTNSEATPDCHDAMRVEYFNAYSAAKIQEDTTCPL
jgi:hypothetical protein